MEVDPTETGEETTAENEDKLVDDMDITTPMVEESADVNSLEENKPVNDIKSLNNVTLEEATEKEDNDKEEEGEDFNTPEETPNVEPEPNIDILPASEYRPTFKINFNAKIPEDYTEKVSFDVKLSDILEHKSAPPRKTIVDHCLDKRKAEMDPELLEYPMSMIRFKQLRMDPGLKMNYEDVRKVRTSQDDIDDDDDDEEEEMTDDEASE